MICGYPHDLGTPHMLSQHQSFQPPEVWKHSQGATPGDFYAAVGGDRLVLIAGKMLKIYDLTMHSGAGQI